MSETQDVLKQIEQGKFSEEDFNFIKKTVGAYYGKRLSKFGDINNVDDLTLDFILDLGTKNRSFIETTSHLYKEFDKFYRMRHYKGKEGCEQHKAWLNISKALNDLGKENRCIKTTLKNIGNNNDTEWALCGNEKKDIIIVDWSSFIIEKMTKLPLSKAKELVEKILVIAESPISVGDIKDIIFKHIEFTSIETMEKTNEDGERYGELEDKSIIPIYETSFDIHCDNEVENRLENLLKNLKNIDGGRKNIIPVMKVLCCYFIPKIIDNKKVSASKIGSSSTVSDILLKIKCAFSYILTDNDFDDSMKKQVAKKIIDCLNVICSEKFEGCNL